MLKKAPINDAALDHLRDAAAGFAADTIDDFVDDLMGDTPIERLFYIALGVHVRLQKSEYTALLSASSVEEEAELLADPRSVDREPTLIIRSQAEIEDGWRVDFLIHAYNYGQRHRPGWRKLIVECDGHDFHERSKEQAAKDRSRDRWATLHRYTILRFTGSELHRNSWECAAQVGEWAGQGLF